MSEKVSFNEELGVIEIIDVGRGTIAQWRRLLEHIQELSDRHDVYRVLVDAPRSPSEPSVMEVFEFARALPRQLSFAIVAGKEPPAAPRFLETVARNRGVRVQVCVSRAEAVAWLAAIVDTQNARDGRSEGP